MPRIKPRRGGPDGFQAAASAIQGARQGYAQGRRQRLQEDRYQLALRRAQRQEAERMAARNALQQMAQYRYKQQEGQLQEAGSSMSVEELNKKRGDMQERFRLLEGMLPHLTPQQGINLIEEFGTSIRQEVVAEEYQRLDQRIMAAERNELFPMPNQIAKSLREGIQEGEITPKEAHERLDQFQDAAAQEIAQQRKIARGQAAIDEFMAQAEQGKYGDLSEDEWRRVERLASDWLISGHLRIPVRIMEESLRNSVSKARRQANPQVQLTPEGGIQGLPEWFKLPGQGTPSQAGGTGYRDLSKEDKLKALEELSAGTGGQ